MAGKRDVRRKVGGAQADEPSGVMTHHLVHDGACWAFLERLVAETADHPGARWLDAGAVFAVTP